MKINKKFENQAGSDAAPFQSSAQKKLQVDFTGLYFPTPEDREFFGCGTADEHELRIKLEHAEARKLVSAGANLELRDLRIAGYQRWRETEGLPDGACVRIDYALRSPRLADPAERTAFGLTPWVPALSPTNALLEAELAAEDKALRALQAANREISSPLKLRLANPTKDAPEALASAILRADLRYFFLTFGMADQPLPLVFGSLWCARAAFEGSLLESPAAELAMRYLLTTSPAEAEELKAHVLPPNSTQRAIYQMLMQHLGA